METTKIGFSFGGGMKMGSRNQQRRHWLFPRLFRTLFHSRAIASLPRDVQVGIDPYWRLTYVSRSARNNKLSGSWNWHGEPLPILAKMLVPTMRSRQEKASEQSNT
ncbi:hypothetical protein GQ600_24304 [Phytophthora cactorum]|nr:hypothetical protein GQ600_24304 [Phytophthora cactorum]